MPLLMSMQEDEMALTKAIESGDTDLGNKPCPLFIVLDEDRVFS